MAQVDFAARQLALKLVYYGPALSGKTSNLRALHARVDAAHRGRLMTLDTRDDRTLFFDLLPIFFSTPPAGASAGFAFQIKVYTVPGQMVHDATRRVVLAGADGIVFVADSRPDHAAANRQAWASLIATLAELGLSAIPIVVQYNKRDLPDAVPLDEVDRFGDPARAIEPACAKQGTGVVPTFLAIVARSYDHLEGELQLSAKSGIDGAAFRAAVGEHVSHDEVS